MQNDEAIGDTYANDRLYSIRNEAMRALEHVTDTISIKQAIMEHEDNSPNLGVIANKALQACLLCNYSSPKIVEKVVNIIKKKA